MEDGSSFGVEFWIDKGAQDGFKEIAADTASKTTGCLVWSSASTQGLKTALEMAKKMSHCLVSSSALTKDLKMAGIHTFVERESYHSAIHQFDV